MITAIYARGVSADHTQWCDFGSADGKLPWGSFKAELEQFYVTLGRLGNSTIDHAIIVGMTTFKTMPETVKRRIEETLCSKTWVVCSSNITNKMSIASGQRVIHMVNALGDSLPSFLKSLGVSGVLLGGSKVIRRFYELNLVDQAYISVIEPKTDKVYCHNGTNSYFPNETTSFLLSSVNTLFHPSGNSSITRVLNATGENVDFKFTQYKEFYN
ncbi:putative dihydrofolate reductase [Pectobacterium phage My1]|uniref:Putative dihydrofolate reductase n=1 Tax=Pectobacterium phage My1 TaxID=1204539 RepID=J9QKZ8_9CAUD|nr:putative dihydrofolate reductase [Pectobacterium phage My1]AFQ22249.1 putative dihydrofolate reductase [Pectobacterium phage My1]